MVREAGHHALIQEQQSSQQLLRVMSVGNDSLSAMLVSGTTSPARAVVSSSSPLRSVGGGQFQVLNATSSRPPAVDVTGLGFQQQRVEGRPIGGVTTAEAAWYEAQSKLSPSWRRTEDKLSPHVSKKVNSRLDRKECPSSPLRLPPHSPTRSMAGSPMSLHGSPSSSLQGGRSMYPGERGNVGLSGGSSPASLSVVGSSYAASSSVYDTDRRFSSSSSPLSPKYAPPKIQHQPPPMSPQMIGQSQTQGFNQIQSSHQPITLPPKPKKPPPPLGPPPPHILAQQSEARAAALLRACQQPPTSSSTTYNVASSTQASPFMGGWPQAQQTPKTPTDLSQESARKTGDLSNGNTNATSNMIRQSTLRDAGRSISGSSTQASAVHNNNASPSRRTSRSSSSGISEQKSSTYGYSNGSVNIDEPFSGVTDSQSDAATSEKEPVSGGVPLWEEYWDDEAEASYYYCSATGEARWEKPDGFI